MGYSEVNCKLCGVSFSIGRIRQIHEPWQSGWGSHEHAPLGYKGHWEAERFNFVQQECTKRDRCPEGSGCCNISRKHVIQSENAHHGVSLSSHVQLVSDVDDGKICYNNPVGALPERFDNWHVLMDDNADHMDLDYSYQSDVTDEPLEYQSDDGGLASSVASREENMGLDNDLCSVPRNEGDASDSTEEDSYEAMKSVTVSSHLTTTNLRTIHAFSPMKLRTEYFDDVVGMSPSSSSSEIEAGFTYCAQNEHFAGSDCIHQRGYSGCLINADDMKGCNVLQCLFRKQQGWAQESDDQPFELSGDYYLSGLSGQVPSRDYGHPIYPVERHNHGDHLRPDDEVFDDVDRHATPMPFHPTCFEVFTRVSRLHLGCIDIDGLLTWRRKTARFQAGLPRHPAISRAAGQWWAHVPGDEFLAANPVLIPGLPAIFQAALETDPNFNVQNSAFEHIPLETTPSTNNYDPFTALPHELILHLLSFLPPLAIANLRLSSYAFRNLPIYFFRDLLQNEMPFLWEISDPIPPSLWAIHTAASIQECNGRPSRLAAQLKVEQKFYEEVFREEMPEVWDAYRADQAWLNVVPEELEEHMKADMLRRYRDKVPIPKFDAERMNWYKLYCGLVKGWREGGLKGLRNRERIWKDMEDVVAAVRGYRERGEIDP